MAVSLLVDVYKRQEREAHDDHVALREAGTHHHAETGKEDATERQDGTAAQYSLRNRSQYRTDREIATTHVLAVIFASFLLGNQLRACLLYTSYLGSNSIRT